MCNAIIQANVNTSIVEHSCDTILLFSGKQQQNPKFQPTKKKNIWHFQSQYIYKMTAYLTSLSLIPREKDLSSVKQMRCIPLFSLPPAVDTRYIASFSTMLTVITCSNYKSGKQEIFQLCCHYDSQLLLYTSSNRHQRHVENRETVL